MPRVAKWLGDTMEGLLGSKFPLMKVMEIAYINPAIKRIRFKGNLSGMNFQLGYAVIIRVNDTEYRNYSVSFSDVEHGILEIIFHLHGTAPGCVYMDSLTVGDHARISMPRGQKQYDPAVKKQLLFGDETSLGMAVAFQPYLKKNAHQFHFYFELEEANKNVPQLLGLENYTIFPKNNHFRNEQWISDLPVFKTADWLTANFILTGNVKSVQTFRRVLKTHHITGRIFTAGFWLEGKTGL
jgi:NADPH-dependent ferric siderophore reductase